MSSSSPTEPGWRPEALNLDEWELFALPADGGSPHATGAGDALRAAGLKLPGPLVIAGDRALFGGGKGERDNVWEIRFSPGSWRVRGAPRQLTFGTENQYPISISATSILALQVAKTSADLYLVPLDPTSGQPTGITRRLTHDGRTKYRWAAGGEPGSAYFFVDDRSRQAANGYALDLESGKQTLVAGVPFKMQAVVSPDGRQIAYSIREGNSYSIRVGYAGGTAAVARALCRDCGLALRFSADGRFLFYQPEARAKPDPKLKSTIRLLEVASGKDKPWLEHPSDSIDYAGTFAENAAWVTFGVRPVGSHNEGRRYIVPWREEPVPPSEWIEVKVPWGSNYSPYSNFFQFFQGAKLMAIRFDPKTRAVSDPAQVKYVPGSAEIPKPRDEWGIRGPGLVFLRGETTRSVWLMKLPE